MDNRVLRLIGLVASRDEMDSVRLSELFQVSERSVRTYVRQANEWMGGSAHIAHRRGGGYALEVEDEQAWEEWRKSHFDRAAAAMPSTPAERVTYLINDLVMRRDWITLDELSEVLLVSRTALSGDLREVEARLAKFNLTLEKRPRYGMRVQGGEMSRRLCLAACAMAAAGGAGAQASDAYGVVSRHAAEAANDSEAMRTIAACVDDVLSESDFHINPVTHQNLLVHISIALLRIAEGCYVPMPAEKLELITRTSEFGVAQHIADAIENRLHIALPGKEVAYIAIHLAGKQTLYGTEAENSNLVISDEVWGVVAQTLDAVWEAFRFDFRNDLELRMNLARHIVPLEVRLRYNLSLTNPLLADIRSRYPLAWSMAMTAAKVIEAHWDAALSDDETSYIALAFALALERNKTEAPKKRVLVVCASGAGSARLLEYRCRKEFSEFIDTITTCDALHLDEVDFSRIDYVFSTVPIERPLPVPVRQVTHFFDAAEAGQVRELLRAADKQGLVGRYFDKNLFFPHLSAATKEDVLNMLCDAAASRGVNANFKELVFKREETCPTSFGNGVAMPHSLEAASDETFVTVGLLDKPVMWDGDSCPVQAVFLISFSRGRGSEHDRELDSFFGVLADFFLSEEAIACLLREQTWEMLTGLLSSCA